MRRYRERASLILAQPRFLIFGFRIDSDLRFETLARPTIHPGAGARSTWLYISATRKKYCGIQFFLRKARLALVRAFHE